jgi:hypothetical protein
MGINEYSRPLKIWLWFLGVFVFLFFASGLLYAQSPEGSGTSITKTSEGFLVSQTIFFPEVPGSPRYEVEIEQQAGGEWIQVERIQSRVNRIGLSLKVGIYRYRYSAYNIMNLLEGQSQWQDFEVRRAMQPQAESYQPFYGLYYEMANQAKTLIINGNYFDSDSEFALVVAKDKFDWSNISLSGRKGVILPDKVEVSGNQAYLTFDRRKLKIGLYSIFIRNPGGLWSVFGEVYVGYRSPVDLNFTIGYSPMIAAFDYQNATTNRQYGEEGYNSGQDGIIGYAPSEYQQLDAFNFKGYYLNLGFTLLKSRIGNFGLEFQFYFLVDNGLKRDWENSPDYGLRFFEPVNTLSLNLYYQMPLTERWSNTFRLGFGLIADFYDRQFIDQNDNSSLFPCILEMGYRAQYFFWKDLFVEGGLDFQYMPYVNHFIIRPGIGFGIQAGRWPEYAEVAESAKRGEDLSAPVTGIPRNEFLYSLGWYPMIPLGIYMYSYDEDGESALQFLSPFNAGGFSLHFAGFNKRWGKNKLGLEIEFSILVHKNWDRLDDNIWLARLGNISDLGFFVLYQRAFGDAWQLNVKGGLGFGHSYIFWDNSSQGPAFNYKAGTSVQYFYWRNAYLEAGLDFTFIQTDIIRSYMKPGIRLGWQFNHNADPGLRLKGSGFQQLRPTS